MADLTLKIKAEELGKSLENLAPRVEEEINNAVKGLAEAAYASMISQVQGMSMDPKNRQDYLRALKFDDLGNNSYLIYLNGDWPNKLEQGFPAYDMKEQLLSSEKRVQVGSRAGEKWVRESSKGNKYAAVPFDQKPYSGENTSGDLASDIKKMTAMNRQGRQQPLTKVFKDASGQPIAGKVASVTKADNPLLAGVTKYQNVSESGKVSSVYLTFRMVSENSTGWQHPGFSGYNLFKQAEEVVEKELENIVNTLL